MSVPFYPCKCIKKFHKKRKRIHPLIACRGSTKMATPLKTLFDDIRKGKRCNFLTENEDVETSGSCVDDAHILGVFSAPLVRESRRFRIRYNVNKDFPITIHGIGQWEVGGDVSNNEDDYLFATRVVTIWSTRETGVAISRTVVLTGKFMKKSLTLTEPNIKLIRDDATFFNNEFNDVTQTEHQCIRFNINVHHSDEFENVMGFENIGGQFPVFTKTLLYAMDVFPEGC